MRIAFAIGPDAVQDRNQASVAESSVALPPVTGDAYADPISPQWPEVRPRDTPGHGPRIRNGSCGAPAHLTGPPIQPVYTEN
jgi:hypothetical protein